MDTGTYQMSRVTDPTDSQYAPFTAENAVSSRQVQLAGSCQVPRGLVSSSHRIEDDCAMHQGFDVARIELQCTIERCQCPL